MNDFKRITKVTFLLRKNSPVNLTEQTYFVNADNFTVAKQKASEQLEEDLNYLTMEIKHELLNYYNKVAMSWIDIIKA